MIDFQLARQQQDEAADQFLADLMEGQEEGNFRQLFERMIRQIELPLPELGAEQTNWLQQSRQLPAWAEEDRIARAQLIFRDHGPKILLLLFYKSLPLLYLNARGAEVLVRTGRLHQQNEDWTVFTRRIAETAQFLIWLMPLGSITKDQAPGRAITQRVRLIHAAIRQTVGGAGWDHEHFGAPINQEDLLMTLLTFGIATFDGLRESFFLTLTEEEGEDYLHFWNVIGHLLGIKEAYLPKSTEHARELLEAILQRQASASPAGHKLADALVQFGATHIPFNQLKLVPAEMIRYFIGPEKAALLGVAPAEGCLASMLPVFLARLLQSGERLEDRARPQLKKALDRLSALTVIGMVSYFDRYKQRPFVVPEVLLEAWKLQRF